MFSGQLPQSFDPRRFTDQGAEIKGSTTVGALPRLHEFRDSRDEPVEVALNFGHDEEGRRVIEGTISTSLVMTCQRCLEPVRYRIEARPQLVLVWSEEQMKALPEHLDPLLVGDERVELAELVEEELLLALPLVAMHDTCPVALVPESPGPDAAEAAPKRDNPFAVLASLRDQQKNRSD